MTCSVMKILVGCQQRQFVPDAKLGQQCINGSELYSLAATCVAKLRRANMIFPVGLKNGYSGQPLNEQIAVPWIRAPSGQCVMFGPQLDATAFPLRVTVELTMGAGSAGALKCGNPSHSCRQSEHPSNSGKHKLPIGVRHFSVRCWPWAGQPVHQRRGLWATASGRDAKS